MSSVEHRVSDDLHAYSDLAVTDLDIERARQQFGARLAATAGRRTRSRFLVAVAVAVLAVAIGATWWFSAPGPDAPPAGETTRLPNSTWTCTKAGQTPEVPALPSTTDGFIALPPERATPGSPPSSRQCELVISFYSHPRGGYPLGKTWLYSDGRVITAGQVIDAQHPAPSWEGGGYFEQRLTPEGVERVRSIAATLLGDPIPDDEVQEGTIHGAVVRYGDRLFRPRDSARFAQQLFDLSWLPDSAWQDKKPRTYVPTWYVACYGGDAYPIKRSRVLSLLPTRGRDLLRGKETTARAVDWEDNSGRSGQTTRYCTVLTTAEARVIVDDLVDDLVEMGSGHVGVNLNGGAGVGEASIDFEVLMPHGEPGGYGA